MRFRSAHPLPGDGAVTPVPVAFFEPLLRESLAVTSVSDVFRDSFLRADFLPITLLVNVTLGGFVASYKRGIETKAGLGGAVCSIHGLLRVVEPHA